MHPSIRKLALLLCLAGLVTRAAAQKKSAPAQKTAPPKAATPATGKSAFDKATLEAYVRHLYVLGPQFQVKIGEPVPSKTLPGFEDVDVHVIWQNGTQDVVFFVSKDGRKIVSGSVYDIAQNPFKPELDKIKTEFAPSFGTPGATVVVVLFTDFQCPYCREEAKMLRANLPGAYPKQVRVYFKNLPLDQIHPWARPAAIAGRCIFRQNAGAFWEYYDWIYEHQAEINPQNFRDKLLEWAKGKEIDSLQLTRCLDTKATEAEVERDIAEARQLNVRSTPTMFVNGRRIEGQRGWPDLRNIIDYEIEYQKTARNAGEDCGCSVEIPAPGAPKPQSAVLGR